MAIDTKTYLLAGALGAAVLVAAGYGLYQEGRRPKPSIQPGRLAPTGSIGDENRTTGSRIEAPRMVSANGTGYEARYLGPAGRPLLWSIQGGTLTSDNFRETVRWSAGGEGVVTLSCQARDESGTSAEMVARVAILPAPTVAGFQAQTATLTRGESTRLGWKAKDFRRLILDPGAQDVSTFNGPGFEVNPTETTEYTLTALDDLGTGVSQKTTVTVVAPPEVGAVRLEPQVGAKDTYRLVGTFKNGRAELRDGAGAVLASASESPLQATLPDLKAGVSLSFVVRNAANATATSALQVAAPKP